jgi:hypothetical protein
MSVTVDIVPNGTAQNTGFIGSPSPGGPEVWTYLSDASDSTYVSNRVAPPDSSGRDAVTYEMGGVALPAGAMVASVTPWVRVASRRDYSDGLLAFGGTATQQWLRLSFNTDYLNPAGIEPMLVQNVGNWNPVAWLAFATRNRNPLTGAQWDQASLDALRLTFSTFSWNGSTFEGNTVMEQVRLYEALARVVYAVQPVVTITGPSSPITSIEPLVTWTWTPDPSYPYQARYRIVVHDYTLGADIWDSGEVVSASNLRSLDNLPFVDGRTYRISVAAAAAIDTRLHWSEWSYVDVAVDLTEPTVVVTQPTTPVATSQPLVTWTWSSTPQYPTQDRYQARVFSAAQYVAAGFDPETSEAAWSGGLQLGTALSAQVTTNLENATSYRAYVRAAAVTPGGLLWSPWAFRQFDVSVVAPGVPLLVVIADDESARIRIEVTPTESDTPTEWVHVERRRLGGAWETVRSGDVIPTAGAEVVLYDYETGNGEVVDYRAQAVATAPDVASAFAVWIGASWSYTDTLCRWWLKSPRRPDLNVPVLVAYGGLPTMNAPRRRGVHSLLGRRDFVSVGDVRKSYVGDVRVGFRDVDELAQVFMLLDDSGTLLLQAPPGDMFGSRYIDVGDALIERPAHQAPQFGTVAVSYVEVLAPAGDILGAPVPGPPPISGSFLTTEAGEYLTSDEGDHFTVDA